MKSTGSPTISYRPPAVAPASTEATDHPSPAQLLQHSAVAARAYSLWQQSGAPQGGDQQYWFAAERALRREAESFAGKS